MHLGLGSFTMLQPLQTVGVKNNKTPPPAHKTNASLIGTLNQY
jgi:hypothetical protein